MATSAAPAINHDSMAGSGDAQVVVEVAEMLDTLAAADVQLTIGELDEQLARLRRALAVRQLLAAVDPAALQAALLGRRRRMLGEGR
jgi:hypothetical protein